MSQLPTWSREQIEQLTQLWTDGWSGSQIGHKIGKSRNAVIGKVHRMGFPLRMQEPRKDGLRPQRKKPTDPRRQHRAATPRTPRAPKPPKIRAQPIRVPMPRPHTTGAYAA